MLRILSKIQFLLCVMLLGLIVLGAGVRLASAGLACPDWPKCFGVWIPDFDFQIFMEWIHRLIAMICGLIALFVALIVFFKREFRSLYLLAVLNLALFAFQAFLGRQTVIELLHSYVVTSHLAGGYALLALNILIYFKLKKINERSLGLIRSQMTLVYFSLAAVSLQAIIGALVSSKYLGTLCPDFPTCQGQWWPPMPMQIHMIHRYMGTFVFMMIFFAWIRFKMNSFQNSPVLHWLKVSLFIVTTQFLIGVTMIFFKIHPGLSVLHSLGAVTLFSSLVIAVLKGRGYESHS